MTTRKFRRAHQAKPLKVRSATSHETILPEIIVASQLPAVDKRTWVSQRPSNMRGDQASKIKKVQKRKPTPVQIPDFSRKPEPLYPSIGITGRLNSSPGNYSLMRGCQAYQPDARLPPIRLAGYYGRDWNTLPPLADVLMGVMHRWLP